MQQHAIVIANADGVIQLWNDGATQLFGYSPAEAVGQKLDLVVPAEYREHHWAGFRKAMASGITASAGTFFDAPAQCHDGVKTLRGQLHVLHSEGKGAIGAMAIFSAPA